MVCAPYSETNLKFQCNSKSQIFVKEGSATGLSFIKDSSMHLICKHPPYATIIRYLKNVPGDISHLVADDFILEMKKVAVKAFQVLKKERYMQ